MEQQERLEKIKVLIRYLGKDRVRIVEEHIQDLKIIYRELHGVNVNTGCGTCLNHYLNMLSAYYEREYPIWLSAQPQEEKITTSNKKKKNEKSN